MAVKKQKTYTFAKNKLQKDLGFIVKMQANLKMVTKRHIEVKVDKITHSF
jgi:hypothetical protein